MGATKFHIIVLGCQMNYSDAARIRAVLTHMGRASVSSIDEADVVIFDTCSVRQKSEDKVTGKLKEIPKSKKIRLTGCMVQHYLRNAVISSKMKHKKVKGLMTSGNFVGTVQTTSPQILGRTSEEINEYTSASGGDVKNVVFVNNAFNPLFYTLHKENEHVELCFRIDDTGFLPLMAQHLGYHSDQTSPEIVNEYTRIIPPVSNQIQQGSKTVFLPISTGCSQFCAFCIVPYARGLEKHLPVEQIIQQAKHHITHGAQEITLLGQIVNKHPHFVQICKEILAIPGLKRLRYTSPYPNFFPDELLALHEHEEKMCPHIHMPLQAGSDIILKKMFRGYTIEQYKTFVDRIRALKRPISITSDVVVGFCGESDDDRKGTMEVCEYAQFDMIYMGIYSPRPGTYAARHYTDDIPKALKHQRRTQLNELLKNTSAHNNLNELGQTKEIMINHIGEETISGYTDNMKTVIVTNVKPDHNLLGTFMRVKITDSKAFSLFGEKISH